MTINEPYNPLDKKNLGTSVADAMLMKRIEQLPPAKAFDGAGIYAIYYLGDFAAYKTIADANKSITKSRKQTDTGTPIYVGKAVPEGARKGGFGLDAPTGSVLYKRLNEHAKSIQEASNLKLEDFRCRYLTVDDIWIPLGESLLIEMFRPLWNMEVDGFGNHDPGKGRYEQQKSSWDILHPGRAWAEKCKPGKPETAILAAIAEHLRKK